MTLADWQSPEATIALSMSVPGVAVILALAVWFCVWLVKRVLASKRAETRAKFDPVAVRGLVKSGAIK